MSQGCAAMSCANFGEPKRSVLITMIAAAMILVLTPTAMISTSVSAIFMPPGATRQRKSYISKIASVSNRDLFICHLLKFEFNPDR